MPISTENSGGALVGKPGDKSTKRVTFLKQTFVASLNRNSAVGETQDVSAGDARFLIAYRYAKVAVEEAEEAVSGEQSAVSSQQEEVESSGESETEVEVESSGEPVEESTATGEDPRRFTRGSRRRRG